MAIIVATIENMLKCCPALSSIFKEECSSLIRNTLQMRTEKKDYSKTETYMLFLQNSFMTYEEATGSLEKNST